MLGESIYSRLLHCLVIFVFYMNEINDDGDIALHLLPLVLVIIYRKIQCSVVCER